MTELFSPIGMPDYHTWPDTPRCIDADPEAFFPPKGGDARPALALCDACPVATECLTWALGLPAIEDHGVWGGTTERQRVQMRARMGRAGVRSRWAA